MENGAQREWLVWPFPPVRSICILSFFCVRVIIELSIDAVGEANIEEGVRM